jgi:hypothetical protein
MRKHREPNKQVPCGEYETIGVSILLNRRQFVVLYRDNVWPGAQLDLVDGFTLSYPLPETVPAKAVLYIPD